MTIEAALIKPVVDVLLALFQQGSDLKLKHNAQASVREAIRELLQANPDENRAAARIAIARAAGILSEDVMLAEDMLQKTRAAKAKTSGKASTGRKRKLPAAPRLTDARPSKPDDKPAPKKPVAAAKKATRKP